jgi:PAS domain S-box-containing protein
MIPEPEAHRPWPSRFRRASAVLSAAVVLSGLLALAGWFVDVPELTRAHPWFLAMKADTAALLVILGAGLWLARDETQARARRLCGLAVLAGGALSLTEYLLGMNLGIDQPLVRYGLVRSYPGRMSPVAAATLMVLGGALLAPTRGRPALASQIAVLMAAAGSLVELCGYLYGVRAIYAIGRSAPIAVHTALALQLSCGAFLLAQPETGVMRVPGGDTAAGGLVRRLLPMFVLAQIAIGWFFLQGHLRGNYGAALSIALMVLSSVILATGLIWRFAWSLHRSEVDLRTAAREIAALNQDLEHRVQVRTAEVALAKARLDGIIGLAGDAIVSIDDAQRITMFNKGAEETFGWSAAEAIGQPIDVLLPARFRSAHQDQIRAFAAEPTRARKMSERRGVTGLRKSGEEFPAEAAISKLAIDAGHVFTAIVRDISARVRFEDERQVFSALIENSPDYIGIADPDRKPLYLNPAGRRLVGLDPDASLEQFGVLDFYPPEMAAFAADVILGSTLEHGRWSGETYRRNVRTGASIAVSDEHFVIRDRTGRRLLGIGTVARDVSEARRVNDQLRESEERFRLTIDEAPIGMALVALDGRFVRVNRVLCEIVGYSADDLTKLTFQAITHPDDLGTDLELAAKLARGEIPRYQLEKRYLRKDGRVVDVMLSASLLRDHDGAPRVYIAQIEDITERKRAEAALRVSEESLSLAMEASDQALWDWRVATDEVRLSPRYWALIGYPPDAQRPNLAFFQSLIPPDDLRAVQEAIREHLEGKSTRAVIEYRVTKATGEEAWFRGVGRVVARDREGRPLRMVGVIADITGEKRFRDERARALREKEMLLKEVHHRVKNNLQILSSLFYLQRERTTQESLRTLLDESRNRIQSIALIHEKLYRSEDLARIDFGDYLNELVGWLAGVSGTAPGQVAVRVHAPGVLLDVQQAIPCALIVNELISNVLKHAFPGGRRGEVAVEAGWAAPGVLRLSVADTGVGFPAGVDFRNTDTLGMQLVCSLTTQLRGTVTLDRAGGTRFVIEFPARPR